ncbi:mandelate racemase [Paralimibaculum aggregatum]|uniref:Mandelate racemase n=1 Tax=Paralimibaculum aggregatum TaxID=3036245 RepID=A0ABQ6LSJ4_9RHOB|nr:mandelate racemase [Limibaculum sp. NKW23]GMG85045.1 mandelate racemase [Limibaculum sp. NKW23]
MTSPESAPRFRVIGIAIDERPVGLRIPFRYGAVTLRAAVEARVTARIRMPDGREAEGAAAELMAPKWFDKSPALTDAENVAQLRRALALTRARYLGTGEDMTAFGLHAAHDAAQRAEAAREGLNGLVAGFGMALIDKAVIGALCAAVNRPFAAVVRANLIGLGPETAPDLSAGAIARVLAGLAPAPRLLARHTVGQIDPLTAAELAPSARLNDGLPETLEEAIAAWGLKAFKLKLSGRPEADLERLRAIAAVIDRIEGLTVTLDGNEQFADGPAFAAFWQRAAEDPALARLRAAIAFVEQPVARAAALSAPLGPDLSGLAVEIDESDDCPDAFPGARAMGYRGVSAKSCKGVYRALLNRVRVAAWNADAGRAAFFMSAEDLSSPPGLAVEQDLALASVLGLGHTERNGHFYGDGRTGLDPEAIAAIRARQPGLYRADERRLTLRIEGGEIDTAGLHAGPGYGARAAPARAG